MKAILLKELRSLLRERRGYLVPMLYAAVLVAAAFLFASWISRDTKNMGMVLTGLVAVVQTVALLVLAPLVGASSIASEREQGTWTSMLASPVSRTSLGLGKALAGCLYVLLLMSVSVPLAALSLVLGGPDAGTLLGLYLTHAVLGITLVSLGLMLSSYFQRTWTASLVAVALSLGLGVLSLAPYIVFRDYRDCPISALPFLLRFNPGYGVLLFFYGDDDLKSRAEWLYHYGSMLSLAAASFAILQRRLRTLRE